MKVVSVTPWWQAVINYAEYTFAALTVISALLLVLDILGENKKKKK